MYVVTAPRSSPYTLPQLNVGEESLPHRPLVVLVQHDNLFSIQGPTASSAVGGPRVSPGCSEDKLVANGEAQDEEETDGIFEEVVRREWSSTLVPSISFKSWGRDEECRGVRSHSRFGAGEDAADEQHQRNEH